MFQLGLVSASWFGQLSPWRPPSSPSNFFFALLGEWSRDRACEGRNGVSKLVSDWELWTTFSTGVNPYGMCSISHLERIHSWKFAYILNIIWNLLKASVEEPSIHPDEKQLSDPWEKRLGDIMNPTLRENTSPAEREPKNSNAIWTPEKIPAKLAIWETFDHPPSIHPPINQKY